MSHFDPAKIQELLTKKGLIDVVYDAIKQNDIGNIVKAALEVLLKTKQIPELAKMEKSKKHSDCFFVMGESAREQAQYVEAFSAYSQALMCAPKESNAMLMSYYGRSCLLFDIKAFSACMNDVTTCLSMNPSKNISTNLKRMHQVCSEFKAVIDLCETSLYDEFAKIFFNFNVEKHSQVPCASAAVEIKAENGWAEVSAAKDISVGTVVALETAYVGNLHAENKYLACSYCHKFSLNLIPCDTCCECLFCSNDCKERCWKEYHCVECHIINLYDGAGPHAYLYALTVKAALKLQIACSWEEFISLSTDLENNQNCPINKIFDMNNKESILNYNNERNLVSGVVFNASFNFANIIHQLDNVPSFYPENPKKKLEAQKALGKVLLNLFVSFPNIIQILNAVKHCEVMQITTEPEENFGFFSFTSKLGHSCDPNLLVVGLNNKVALIAIKSIKCGEELKISHIGHWYGNMHKEYRSMVLFRSQTRIMCRCRVCVERWDPSTNLRIADMSKQQRAIYKKWNTLRRNPTRNTKVVFQETCRCLDLMTDLAHTREHLEVYAEFRNLITLFQFSATKNATL